MTNYEIENLGFSIRTINCLRRANILTIEQLMNTPLSEIAKIRNAGAKTVQEVADFKNTHLDDYISLNGLEPNLEKSMVINQIYPEYKGIEIDSIQYRDSDGIFKDDILIDSIKSFGTRTHNCLNREGLLYISDVANYDFTKLLQIPSFGQKGVNEILEYLKNNTRVAFNDEKQKKLEELCDWFKSTCDYKETEKLRFVTYSILRNIEDYMSDHLEKDETYIDEIVNKDNVRNSVKDFILSYISENEKVNDEDIRSQLAYVFYEKGIVKTSINSLIQENKIEFDGVNYSKRLPRLSEWIESLKENQRDVLTARFNGATLEECGAILGSTREWARQIIQRTKKKKPLLREDDYRYWFEKYDFREDEFKIIFNEKMSTYYYLKEYYKKGLQELEEMTWDSHLSGELYRNLLKVLNRQKVIIDGDYVDIKREIICRKLAEVYCSEEKTFSEFYDIYMTFLRENNLEDNEKLLFPSERAFEARVSDSQYVLLKYGKRMRYYPINEYDIADLVNQLQFEQFSNIEVSTLKIYRDNEDLMREYNIEDEYELHNLLKKTQDNWNEDNKYNCSITRMPLMTFGDADRNKQALDLLFQVAPCSIEEYSKFYEMEYGMLAQTVMANVSPVLAEYYHEGYYQINQPLLDEDEFNYLKESLKNRFYLIKDIHNIYLQRFDISTIDRVNPRTLKMLGFRVYVDYVVSNKYQNAYEFFVEQLLENDTVDYRKLEDGKLTYIQISNGALDDLRRDYSLLEYEDMKFITFDKLHEVYDDITKDMLRDYAKDAIAYDDEKYFTVQSLRKRGFSSKLHEIGLGEWFNACLIRNYPGIRFIKTGGNIVFRKGDRQITTIDFFRFILNRKIKMDIYEFVSFIKKEYAVELEKEKVINLVKDTELYYDPIMEKIYVSKDYYYDEI